MIALFIVTGAFYALACGLYIVYLSKGNDVWGRRGNAALAVATASHVAFIVGDYFITGRVPFGDIHETLSPLSLLIVLAYLAAQRRWPILVLGAFLTPITLLLFTGGAIGRSVGAVSPAVRSALLPWHIGVNVLGIVAFTFAFALALAYVIQERLLRRKQLSGLFQRLPALHVLDSLSFRAVLVGFPLLTIGVITGTVWAVRLSPNHQPPLSAAQGFGLLAWLVFAAVLLLRVAAGWRGRRAAIGTMVGFALALAVLATYLLRSTGGPA